MNEFLVIDDPANIPQVLDLVHDCLFSVEEIWFDSDESVLSIRFAKPSPERRQVIGKRFLLWKRVRTPTLDSFLKVSGVQRYEIRDRAKIGIYGFNDMQYDSTSGRLVITTDAPCQIDIDVTKFEVAVKVTENVLSWS